MTESRKREEIGKKNKEETVRRRTQGPLKMTAREGTLEPQKETARVTTFEARSHPMERWRVQEKRKEGKWKKRKLFKKKKKKKVEDRQRKWWKKCKEFIMSLSMMRMKKESKRSERRTKARQTLEKLGKWLFLLLSMGQN